MGCNFSRAPPPEELKAAVGTWRGVNSEGDAVTFVLWGDGSFWFARDGATSSLRLQGPIKQWRGRSFDNTCCCCSWHFELQQPVHDPELGLTMDVNGALLAFVGPPSIPN